MYTYEIKVGYSTLDESLGMTISAILDCFQDAAIFEAENGKITMDYLGKRSLAWLLSSWQIVIDRRPKLNEKIKITTLPYAFKGFMGYRNFTITDENENIIVKGTSIWTLIDMKKLIPAKLEQEMIDGYKLGEKLDMNYAPRKIALIGAGEIKDSFTVRSSQIDSNRHMNNVEYVKLAMEYIPENTEVSELRVEYRKAAYRGDELTAVVHKGENKLQIQLNSQNKETCAVVEFTFSDNENGEQKYE